MTRRTWYLILIALTLLMITVGGATRLTRSGLSIVDWKPVTGVIPPLTDSAWLEEFERYQQTPEFQKVNAHFDLSAYKQIYFWEYVHRLLGRVIFLAALIPGLVLWRKRRVPGKTVVLFCSLVLVQGIAGWVMVKSGLRSEPRVSHYLLALHYFLALTFLSTVFFWHARERAPIQIRMTGLKRGLLLALGTLLPLQLFFGSLMSGLRAGLVSQTFPLMLGQWTPPVTGDSVLKFSSVFENPFIVHWVHRWLGIVTLAVMGVLVFHFLAAAKKADRGPLIHLMGISSVQVVFGISLILFQVPVWLGVLHQLLGALIVLAYLNLVIRLRSQLQAARRA